ncbi:hypothetical protein [Anaeromyxobacter oryzisoli]|uniref:hypothetical protein n=1 Tax=Anaeromyxobacter oryzisoli TaxID=2925408 RepID=UPI001F584A61|nr:hypothetical protein [Anaeromyxobacter sp. SG63]
MFERTDTPVARRKLVPGDHEWHARLRVLEIVTGSLARNAEWMQARAEEATEARELRRSLERLSR